MNANVRDGTKLSLHSLIAGVFMKFYFRTEVLNELNTLWDQARISRLYDSKFQYKKSQD